MIDKQSLFYFLNLFLIKYTNTDIIYITRFTTTIDAADENSEKKKNAVVNAIHATTTVEITTLLKLYPFLRIYLSVLFAANHQLFKRIKNDAK